MAEQTDIPLRVFVDDKPTDSQTRATSVGAYVLVLDTTLPDHGIDLHSVYVGHSRVRTQSTHLLLAPSLRETLTTEHEHESIPVVHARRRCLYDHLQRLQDLLSDLDIDAHIPVGEDAIATVES